VEALLGVSELGCWQALPAVVHASGWVSLSSCILLEGVDADAGRGGAYDP